MVRLVVPFAALLVAIACNLSLDDGESESPFVGPPPAPTGALNAPQQTTCFASSDCPAGYRCGAEVCEDLPATCSRAGIDCPAGWHCARFCESQPDSRMPQGLAGTAGSTGADRGGSARAAADAGGCLDAGACESRAAVCLANDECTNGLCVNNRCQSFCTTDAECALSDACWLGLCRSGAGTFECLGASDCPDSGDCVGGSCLRRCLNHEHCAGGDDGPVCGVGYCGP